MAITHTYTGPGVYTVRATVKDSENNESFVEKKVTVIAASTPIVRCGGDDIADFLMRNINLTLRIVFRLGGSSNHVYGISGMVRLALKLGLYLSR